MRTQTLERTKKMVTLALLSGLLIVMGFTPLGYLKVSGLFEITFNAVPVAIAAITVGPVGGVVTGAVFGITSFIQLFSNGDFGMLLFNENPFYMIIMLVVTRIVMGLGAAYIFKAVKRFNMHAACFATGLGAALLNTVLYCACLYFFYGHGKTVQGMMENGGSIFIFLFGAGIFVNAAVEAVASTILSGALGMALIQSGFVKADVKKKAVHSDK
ncbi:MAG: ECF transporter S component [Clostridiales bacterium]|nr:ECF transporter S component [Clostridiales bacterium]